MTTASLVTANRTVTAAVRPSRSHEELVDRLKAALVPTGAARSRSLRSWGCAGCRTSWSRDAVCRGLSRSCFGGGSATSVAHTHIATPSAGVNATPQCTTGAWADLA